MWARTEVLPDRHSPPLVVRGRSEKTFFSLGAFVGVALMAGGTYLVLSAFRDPLGASDVAVLTGSFALALSGFMLLYFLGPRRRLEIAKGDGAQRFRKESELVLTAYGEVVQKRMVAKEAMEEGKRLPGPM